MPESWEVRRRAVECARYEADLARRRYLQVDPANRLVADELEAQWNRALQQVVDAQETYDRHRQGDRLGVNEEARARILALATDFSRLWHDPHTPDRERKRMVRLLNAWQLRETSTEIVALIDQLLDQHTDESVATVLNARGYVSGTGRPFQGRIVQNIRREYQLRSRYERLRVRGMLSRDEIAGRLKVSAATVKVWGHHGLLPRYVCNDKGECLYEPPGPNAPIKMQGRRLSDRRSSYLLSDQTNEVQYEA